MIYTSFDCTSSPEDNEESMNKIGWEMKAGDWSKDLTHWKKHPVYIYIFIFRNAKKRTPLACCAVTGMSKSAVILLEADAAVDPRDITELTPLHIACQHGHHNMVQTLLE